MLLSKATGYGVRALAYLAQPHERLCGLQEIAGHERIPSVYLRKVLGELRRHRFLRSVKGIHGGYELARPAQSISIWDVFAVLDSDPYLDQCLLRSGTCRDDAPCALCGHWREIRADIVELMRSTTIAELASRSETAPGAAERGA